jgi:hypothetical protein
MWTDQQDLVFSFKMALREALSVIRGMRRSLTEDQQQRVAEMMVDHLERQNWKFERGPAGDGGSRLMG